MHGAPARRRRTIIGIDANAHVGEGENPAHIGSEGAEEENVQGQYLRRFVVAHNLCLANTFPNRYCGPTHWPHNHRIDFFALDMETNEDVETCELSHRLGRSLQYGKSWDHRPLLIRARISLPMQIRPPTEKIAWHFGMLQIALDDKEARRPFLR